MCGRRSMRIKGKEQVHSALVWDTERTCSFFFDCTPFRETRSYIPRPVCEGKPFCAIEIKVEYHDANHIKDNIVDVKCPAENG